MKKNEKKKKKKKKKEQTIFFTVGIRIFEITLICQIIFLRKNLFHFLFFSLSLPKSMFQKKRATKQKKKKKKSTIQRGWWLECADDSRNGCPKRKKEKTPVLGLFSDLHLEI